ncbi:MAG TPA: hypothetical protein VK135_00070 [Candidatus Dormibacteraeota bacterium]|nr:hypothetical protein [Candidatus Dormibacteraeota bacterium]
MVIKKKLKNLLVFLLFITLLIYFYNLHQEKRMYEEYISIDIYNDMSTLVVSIIENYKLYENILEEEVITRGDADRLKWNAYNILEFPQHYGSVASQFNRIKSEVFHNETAETAAQIADFFSEMNGDEEADFDNMDEVIYELNDVMEDKMMQLKELNSLWVNSVFKNVAGTSGDKGEIEFDSDEFRSNYEDNSVSDNFWVDLILDLDEDTRNFLTVNELNSIEEVIKN